MRLPLLFRRKTDLEESEIRSVYWVQKRLYESDRSLILLDTARDLLNGYAIARLIPRLNAQPKISDLGNDFSLCYEVLEREIRIFSITPGFPELLEQSYELERWAVPAWRKYGHSSFPATKAMRLAVSTS